jgi:hypothetical protein
MTAIGGFFELELPGGGAPYHEYAFPMASGRACLRRILECLRPRRLWTPFYVCDAVLPAIQRAGSTVQFYAIDDALDPVLPQGVPAADEVVMYVNYFGIKGATAARLAGSFGRRAIVDDTQAFFQKGYAGSFSFNSARKFFGVPDGGFAYGDGLEDAPVRQPQDVRCDHLVNRLLGRQQAFEQYRQSEACVSDAPVAMSSVSARLLANVDCASALAARRRNFGRLHELIGGRNRLAVSVDAASAGPFCYPFLAETPIPWDRVWSREIFAPRLWPELDGRRDRDRFAWECELGARVLPLPVDHRYGIADMDRVAGVVAEVLGW